MLRGCSYRSLTPKTRLIPLSQPFLDYLRADGIILTAEESDEISSFNDADSRVFSSTSSDSDDKEPDPSLAWQEVHQAIKSTLAELGGSVVPKLNWSAPKDATWISATNSMECQTPNDIYLLLKSSDFVSHDLEQAFDDCEDRDSDTSRHSVPYHLALRKTIPALITSLEFRCFVRARQLIAICQRDLNHYDFLPSLVPTLRNAVQGFFEEKLQRMFPDENFVFDVYIPQPYKRVWLIDINPWAAKTDPLLFSWMELLTLKILTPDQEDTNAFIRLSFHDGTSEVIHPGATPYNISADNEASSDSDSDSSDLPFLPEFRLVNRDDPEAYSFNTPRYSAHKLPKDVVDAAGDGEAGLREFMSTWRDIVAKQEKEDQESVED